MNNGMTISGSSGISPASKHDAFAEFLILAQILTATVMQKFAITVGGQQIYLALILMLGITVLGLVSRRLMVSALTLSAYALAMGVLVVTQLFNEHEPSIASVILLLAANCFYLTRLKPNAIRPGIELTFFLRVMAVLAVLGIAQYALQFVIGSDKAFFIEYHIPQSFLVQNFHALNPVGYGSTIFKSNGVFFLEPSIFCQFLSIAVIIELLYFRNWLRMVLFFIAIAVTFSGTGLIILAALLPIYLAQKKQIPLLLLGAAVVLTAGIWMPLVGLQHTYDRAFEFMNPNTSGYARFISMFVIANMFLLDNINTFMFGLGGGSIRLYVMPGRYGFETFDPTWGKVAFEYGFLGLFAYLAFMVVVFQQGTRSRYLKSALFIQFIFLGEFVLSPTVHGLIISLLLWPSLTNFDLFEKSNLKNSAL